MEKFKDTIRFILISPEILSALLMLTIAKLQPGIINFFSKFVLVTDSSTLSIIVTVPLAMLVGAYTLGYIVLNPTENKVVLMRWPQYWMVKNRVIFSWVLGAFSFIGTIAAYYVANNGDPQTGTLLIAIFWVVIASSVASIAYARMSIHYILIKTKQDYS